MIVFKAEVEIRMDSEELMWLSVTLDPLNDNKNTITTLVTAKARGLDWSLSALKEIILEQMKKGEYK